MLDVASAALVTVAERRLDRRRQPALVPPHPIQPQPGPQTQFAETTADIVVYGGQAGGGKTLALLMDAIWKGHTNVGGFGAVIFRRTYPDITNEGGMWDESEELYDEIGGVSRENKLDWTFPSGSRIRFAHMQHVKDRLRWKGSQIPLIAFDQLEEFEAAQFWYLTSRNRSKCGVRPYIRATCNPDPDSWVKSLLAPWVDDEHSEFPFPAGEMRYLTREGDDLIWVDESWRDPDDQPARSITFIPASVYDNPALLETDPAYLAVLRALPLVDRERLLGGNWNIRAEGNTFKREWFKIQDAWPADLELIGRSWDLAGTEKKAGNDPDFTVGGLIGFKEGVWYIGDVKRDRLSPASVDALMDQTAGLDGWEIPILLQQDPGEAGKRGVQAHAKRLKGYDVRWRPPTGDKTVRARPLASAAEAGNVVLVKGDDKSWIDPFINECVVFPGKNDDQVDMASWAMLMLAFPDDAKKKRQAMPEGYTPDKWLKSSKMRGRD